MWLSSVCGGAIADGSLAMDSRARFPPSPHVSIPLDTSDLSTRRSVSDTSDPADTGGPSLPKGVSLITIEDELKRSYLDYAMSVIVSRALPDVRDGLEARAPAHPVRHG